MSARHFLETVKQEVAYYRAVSTDPRTPKIVRWCLIAAIAYLLSPIDLIPDFIPVLGQLDDLLIVGGLIFVARRFIPKDVRQTHRLGQTRPQ